MCLSPRLIRLVDEVIEDNWPGLPLSDTKTAPPSAPNDKGFSGNG